MRRIVAAFVAAFLAAGPLAAQEKRPIGVEDFLGMKIASDIQLSPDGGTVAFTVTIPSLADNRGVSRIYLHTLADGVTRELTRGPGSDQRPRWARDGRTLAFISTRSGTPQVWRIRIDGGEPAQMTSLPDGVNEFWWAPDAEAVFVTSDVKWPEESELDRREKDQRSQARIWTDLFYRHWNEWRVGVRQHLFRVGLADGKATDLTRLDRDVPSLALGGNDVAASPLGTELAVVMNPDSGVATSTNNDIFLMGPDGSGIVPMTQNPANDHSPTYSPNARWVAYLAMATPGFEADRQELILYDRATGERTSLTAAWDVSVQTLLWTADSKSLIVEVEERGEHNIYRLPVPAGPRVLLVSGGTNTNPQISARGDLLVYLHQSAARPPELFGLRIDPKLPPSTRQLTQLNTAALAGLDIAPVTKFGFVGAKGDSVFGLLVKPPAFDSTKKYPVVYLIHGGPQSAWVDAWHQRWNYALFAARGYVVAAVNFHGSTGYGQAFTNSISKHWGDLPYEDLMTGVETLARLPWVDSTRIGAAGASYGGYMIYWMAGHTDRFKTLVAHDGIFNTESMAGTTEEQWFPAWEFGGNLTSPEARALMKQWSPAGFVPQWKTPMLVVHSQQDFRVDVSEGYQAFTALKQQGLAAKFLYFPDEGHFVLKPRNRKLWWGVVLDWLDQYLKPAAAANP